MKLIHELQRYQMTIRNNCMEKIHKYKNTPEVKITIFLYKFLIMCMFTMMYTINCVYMCILALNSPIFIESFDIRISHVSLCLCVYFNGMGGRFYV